MFAAYWDTLDSSGVDYGQIGGTKVEAIKHWHNPDTKDMIKDKIDVVESLDSNELEGAAPFDKRA